VLVETFANVSGLEWLDLRKNNLRTVDINILSALPELSTLYLFGNPLQCDYKLKEVWRWCEERNIRTAYGGLNELGEPECDTQREVMGIWWELLKKWQCFQGNIKYHGDYKITCYSCNNITVPNNDTDTDPNTGTNKQEIFSRLLNQYEIPLYAFPFIFGTISNIIILIIIIFNKDMQTLPNMYIINLAISDIINLTVIFCQVFCE
jgi:hypothetical protein